VQIKKQGGLIFMPEIDLSLDNPAIYKDVEIESFGGRKSFKVNQQNLDIIGRNINNYIKELKKSSAPDALDEFNKTVTLTGPTAIPVYLAAFHIVVHSFHEVRYKNEMYNVIVARH
jgi:hypothetical protein